MDYPQIASRRETGSKICLVFFQNVEITLTSAYYLCKTEKGIIQDTGFSHHQIPHKNLYSIYPLLKMINFITTCLIGK